MGLDIDIKFHQEVMEIVSYDIITCECFEYRVFVQQYFEFQFYN